MYRKNSLRLILLFGLFAISTQCFQAQTAPAPIPSSDATLLKQVGKAGAFYFKRSDQIKGSAFFYAFGTVDDVYKDQDVITLTLNFQLPGNVFKRPETVSVSITTKSTDTKYTVNHKLKLLADAKVIVDTETNVKMARREGTKYATEIFEFNNLGFKQLEKLSKAKKVVMQLGDTKLVLGDEQRNALRDFYNLVKN